MGSSSGNRSSLGRDVGRGLDVIQLVEGSTEMMVEVEAESRVVSEGELQLALQISEELAMEEGNLRMEDLLEEEDSQWMMENVQRLSRLVGVLFGGFEDRAIKLFREIKRRLEKEREERL